MPIFPATALVDISKSHATYRETRDGSWYGYQDGENWGALPLAVSSLYRGQTTRHLPMLPSIARGLDSPDIGELWRSSISDQAKLILRVAQSWWFSRELTYHPISTHAKNQGLNLDSIAIAQHYGIPTGYLDLTDDFNVSGFFATCRSTNNCGWQPVDDGIGIIYKVELRGLDNPFGQYIPLGPQKLPRPTEQYAWVTELPLCHSFEYWPNIRSLQFHHDKHVGEYFLDMFSGGSELFPADPLAEIASQILTHEELPSGILESVFDSFLNDPFGIQEKDLPELRKEISKFVSIVGDKRLLTNQHVSLLLADLDWSKRMLADVKVRWRAVRVARNRQK